MSRVNYSEEQSFRQVVWIWLIVIPVALLSLAGVLYGFYQQIILGQPWGDEPMNNPGLIIALLVVIVSQAIIIWVVASLQLKIEITNHEFRYKFFAYFTQWNAFTRDQLASYTIEKYTFWKGRGLGYRKDLFTKTVRMIITPSFILSLKTTDGRTIMMSTQNKEEVERAIQKFMSKSEND
jgi:hypothetical protein